MQKNANTAAGPQRVGKRRHMVTAAEMVLGTERDWVLDVWELQGAPETWAGQLDAKYKQQPVFALISGITNGTWEPVQEFCQRNAVPCWFPSVPLPGGKESFYSLYFSQGVFLEAGVLAKYLSGKTSDKPKRLVQVHRDDYVGNNAGKALAKALSKSGIAVEDRILGGDGLQKTLSTLTGKDAIMFWLNRADLAELGRLTAPSKGAIYFSSVLAGGEQGIPPTWKGLANLVYPYELPDQREGNLSYFHSWLKQKNIALVDEPLQSEVFFTVDFLTDTIGEMLDNLYRDYLVERAENMLSRRELSKGEQVSRERQMWGVGNKSPAKQVGTTIYPHLGLGALQRFASKGGYIVSFGEGGKLLAESDWIVP
jgi:hypothetical protein